MQNDFVLPNGHASVSGTTEILPQLRELLTAWRASALPIVHVVRFYRLDGGNAEPSRRSMIKAAGGIVAPGSSGAEIVTELLPPGAPPLNARELMSGQLQELAPCEWAMFKPRWGAFYQTPLEGFLRQMHVSGLAVCGCNLPNCPRATLFEASERDFEAVLVADATSQCTPDRVLDLQLIAVRSLTVRELIWSLDEPISLERAAVADASR